jgi:uncharacterized protein YecE (DUF72 family)
MYGNQSLPDGTPLTNFYLGTMGFSYTDWVGPFYPESMAQRNFLKHYSRFFNAVEIDSTFYGTPRVEAVQRWYLDTPDDFRFCPKVPKVITHEKGLRGAHLDMTDFILVMRALKEKLGVILIQLPPSFGADQINILDNFLGSLPDDLRFAVEFRNYSWYQSQTEQMLLKHHVCWTGTEYPDLPRGITLTSDFAYFRLIGQHGQFVHHNREQIDRSNNLKWWYQHLVNQRDALVSIYGFFNNDYAGFGVGSCNQFKVLAGLPAPDLRPPLQGRLF